MPGTQAHVPGQLAPSARQEHPSGTGASEWKISRTPIAAATDAIRQPSNAQREILRLLSTGLTDAAIASYLDISLRTTARRVALVMRQLGATTRFQAGVEAARRGWLR